MESPLSDPDLIVSGPCQIGVGGLGRHGEELIGHAKASGCLKGYFEQAQAQRDLQAIPIQLDWLAPWFLYTPLRFSHGWKIFLQNDFFDRKVAKQIPQGRSFLGFIGASLHSFRQARRQGFEKLILMAANSHVRNVLEQQRKAYERNPIEPDWMNARHARKILAEYDMADQILVASEYSRRTFLKYGVPEKKLKRIQFTAHPRFKPPADRGGAGKFRIIFVGALSLRKGIPILFEAFAGLENPDAKLILVGHSGTRGMNQYIKGWLKRDPRIRLQPGDPVPILQSAQVYVHPAYEDNLPYAALEAHACGAPMILSEDTGAKELIRSWKDGMVIPTGDSAALLGALEHFAKAFKDKSAPGNLEI